MASAPLVVAVLKAVGEDVDYELYCAAYGLEMQINDEWNTEAVLLTPRGHLHAVTRNTDVTGPDTRIVSAGVTDVPLTPAGVPDLSEIDDERNNWLLVAGPGSADSEDAIRAKVRAALTAGRRVVLCCSEAEARLLPARIERVDPSALGRLVIAYTGPDATRPAGAEYGLRVVQDALRVACGTTGAARVIVGGRTTPADARVLTAIPGIAGIFMPTEGYGDFCDILEALAAIGGPR